MVVLREIQSCSANFAIKKKPRHKVHECYYHFDISYSEMNKKNDSICPSRVTNLVEHGKWIRFAR